MTDKRVRIGTVGYPVEKRIVHGSVDVVELKDACTAPPKPATGKRLRQQAEDRIAFTLQVPRYLFESPPEGMPLKGSLGAYGSFQTTKENIGLWEKTIRFAEAIEADSLVLPTPSEFTPAKANQDALSGFISAVQPVGLDIVWEPHGPWEHEQAAIYAKAAGILLAVDPLRDPPPEGEAAYFRLGPFAAMGSRMGMYDLERLGEAIARFERVTCVFETERALDDARNLKNTLLSF